MDEIPNWRKKKDSSKSLSIRKSKHKHAYEPCVVKRRWDDRQPLIDGNAYYELCDRCKICGCIKVRKIFVTTDDGHFRRMMTADEIYEEYVVR